MAHYLIHPERRLSSARLHHPYSIERFVRRGGVIPFRNRRRIFGYRVIASPQPAPATISRRLTTAVYNVIWLPLIITTPARSGPPACPQPPNVHVGDARSGFAETTGGSAVRPGTSSSPLAEGTAAQHQSALAPDFASEIGLGTDGAPIAGNGRPARRKRKQRNGRGLPLPARAGASRDWKEVARRTDTTGTEDGMTESPSADSALKPSLRGF